MCEFNVGDKFIVEIGEVYCPPGFSLDSDKECPKLYRMKGFKSLVFDEEGLKKLESVTDKDAPDSHQLVVGDVVIDSYPPSRRWIITNIDNDEYCITYSGLYKNGGVRQLCLSTDSDIRVVYLNEHHDKISDWLNF